MEAVGVPESTFMNANLAEAVAFAPIKTSDELAFWVYYSWCW